MNITKNLDLTKVITMSDVIRTSVVNTDATINSPNIVIHKKIQINDIGDTNVLRERSKIFLSKIYENKLFYTNMKPLTNHDIANMLYSVNCFTADGYREINRCLRQSVKPIPNVAGCENNIIHTCNINDFQPIELTGLMSSTALNSDIIALIRILSIDGLPVDKHAGNIMDLILHFNNFCKYNKSFFGTWSTNKFLLYRGMPVKQSQNYIGESFNENSTLSSDEASFSLTDSVTAATGQAFFNGRDKSFSIYYFDEADLNEQLLPLNIELISRFSHEKEFLNPPNNYFIHNSFDLDTFSQPYELITNPNGEYIEFSAKGETFFIKSLNVFYTTKRPVNLPVLGGLLFSTLFTVFNKKNLCIFVFMLIAIIIMLVIYTNIKCNPQQPEAEADAKCSQYHYTGNYYKK
jgi:hypothetical protein